MRLEEFIEIYNRKEVVVLLEGKREVKRGDEDKIRLLGRILASKMDKVTFRSGNAKGSDELFAEGVMQVDPTRMHVIIPDSDHRKKSRKGLVSFSLDDLPLMNEDPAVYESRKYKPTEKLIDRYLEGKRDRTTPKITPIIRDAIKVVGFGNIPPATVGLFYVHTEDPDSGGTGFTKSVCERNGVPVLDQRSWFDWIE
jgi:hypothetical protein